MVIVAKFQGRCTACNSTIVRGASIEWSKGNGARHVDCSSTQPSSDRAVSIYGRNSGGICPTCKVTWMSAAYVRKGYQCDRCADIAEGSLAYEW